MEKRTALVLCTGNSCRSQIAEGLINRDIGDSWQAFSAGTRPAGFVHPVAIQVMAEVGIDISGQRSKSTDEFREAHVDLVITVCDSAAEDCPVWLGAGQRVHLGFADPAKVVGDEATVLSAFRTTREAMRNIVIDYLTTLA